MTTRSYPVGSDVLLTQIYTKHGTQEVVQPASVVCRVLDPNGIETRPAVVSNGPGVYAVKFNTPVAGKWYVRWQAVGIATAVSEFWFTVEPSPFDN